MAFPSLRAGLTTLATALLLAGCETSEPARPAATEARPDPAKVSPKADSNTASTQGASRSSQPAKKAYGEPLTPTAEKVALADLLKDPNRYADKTVRTEGKVTAVCKSKGCWLEIGDEKSMAHVKLGNHRFFVPRSASGQHAEVEARVMPQVAKGHCEQEAQEQTGRVAMVELDATGVELSAVQ